MSKRPLHDVYNITSFSPDDDTQPTISIDSDDNVLEEHIRCEVQSWLAQHGAKLFALEASKWMTQEKRKKDIASRR